MAALGLMSRPVRQSESRILLNTLPPLLQFHASAPTFRLCSQRSKPLPQTCVLWSVAQVKNSVPRLRGCAGLHRCPSIRRFSKIGLDFRGRLGLSDLTYSLSGGLIYRSILTAFILSRRNFLTSTKEWDQHGICVYLHDKQFILWFSLQVVHLARARLSHPALVCSTKYHQV